MELDPSLKDDIVSSMRSWRHLCVGPRIPVPRSLAAPVYVGWVDFFDIVLYCMMTISSGCAAVSRLKGKS